MSDLIIALIGLGYVLLGAEYLLSRSRGVELHVLMVTEGDFVDRCAANLGGTYHAVLGGEAHVCVVPAP